MSGPSLDDLARSFTQARDNAEGYATGTHAGCAAVLRELLQRLSVAEFAEFSALQKLQHRIDPAQPPDPDDPRYWSVMDPRHIGLNDLRRRAEFEGNQNIKAAARSRGST